MSTKMTKEEARTKIKGLIRLAEKLIERDATSIADEYGISFGVGDSGDGSKTYYPKGTPVDEIYYTSIGGDGPEYSVSGKLIEGFWVSSSEQC